jgi:hypothetical protein
VRVPDLFARPAREAVRDQCGGVDGDVRDDEHLYDPKACVALVLGEDFADLEEHGEFGGEHGGLVDDLEGVVVLQGD